MPLKYSGAAPVCFCGDREKGLSANMAAFHRLATELHGGLLCEQNSFIRTRWTFSFPFVLIYYCSLCVCIAALVPSFLPQTSSGSPLRLLL